MLYFPLHKRLCLLSWYFILAWISTTLPELSSATMFDAKVIRVTDGDTITVLNEAKEEINTQLNGIDCPEKRQPYENKTKEFTKDLVAREMVTVQAYENDKYGRTIGDVILEDGRNLSQGLLKAGYA